MLKTFDVYSGQIRVSDPCYIKGIEMVGNIEIVGENKRASIIAVKAKNGRWVAEVVKEERVSNDVIVSLVAYYDEALSQNAGLADVGNDFHKALAMMMAKNTDTLVAKEDKVSVESGVLGVFDNKSYRDDKTAARATRLSEKIVCEDEPWYSICCDRVLTEDQWGVVPNGCVASCNKEGDVRIVTHTNAYGEVVKIELDFQTQLNEKSEDYSSEDEEEVEEYEEDCDCEACKRARGEFEDEDEDEDEEES